MLGGRACVTIGLPVGKWEVFDSSRERDAPFEFKVGVGQLIPGLDKAILKLSKGQIAEITVPPSLGYGTRGYPPVILEIRH